MTQPTTLPRDRQHDLAAWFGHGPRALLRTWMLHVTAGEALGFCVPAAVALLVLDGPPALAVGGLVMAGAVEGAVLGAAQARVLGREILGFSRRAWVAATAGAAALAWLVGMLPSTFSSVWADWPTPLAVAVGVLLGTLALLSLGAAQWLVLRRHLSRAGWWVPGTFLGWAVGLLVFAGITTPLWRPGQSAAVVTAIGVLGGLAMAATMAWVTGLVLVRITRSRPVAEHTPSDVPADEWDALAESTDRFDLFDPSSVGDLPEPVQRWLRHAVTPGTPLLTGAEIEMSGHLRRGDGWQAFRARQRTRLEGGFVWSARTRLAGLPVRGFDRYTQGSGETRWRLLRSIRVRGAADESLTRSWAGRYVAELFAFVPTVALDPGVTWEDVDHRRARALVRWETTTQVVTVRVSDRGRLERVELMRWGTPAGSSYGQHPFGIELAGELRAGGYRVPRSVTEGWFVGSDRWDEGRFLRFDVTRCSHH
jgi:hypothetical protein